MTFITLPLAIAGVCAVAIPIIIFLLWRQRRKPVEWAAMRFLMEAYRKHRRRLQVEQLLLLAVRCLIPLLLGLALARPILERAGLLDGGSSRVVYLLIDDGLAASVEDESGDSALSRHIAQAESIIETLEGGDRVGLITLARPAFARLSPPSTDRDAVKRLIASLPPTAMPTDVSGGIDALRRALAEQEDEQNQAFVYLLSDFRRGSASLEDPLPASLRDLGDRVVLRYAPPASTPVANVQISSIDPARHIVLGDGFDGSGQVTVRLTRQGGELARDVTRVTLRVDELAAPPPAVVTWEPGQSEASCEFRLDLVETRTREIGLEASIDHDRLAGDNTRSTVLSYRKTLRVTLLDRRAFGFEPSLDRLSAGASFGRALAPTESTPVELVTVEPAALDTADLRTSDVVVVPRPDLLTDAGWPLLRQFVDRGGLLILTPPAGRTVHRWPDSLTRHFDVPWSIEREVREADADRGLALDQPPSAMLRMIASDLGALSRPIIFSRWLPVTTTGEITLVFDDGSPFMVVASPTSENGTLARGMVVYLAAAPELEWTNLPSKPLMVPLVHETIRQGLSQIRGGGRLVVGADGPLLLGPAAASVQDPDGDRIPLLDDARPETPLKRSGLYTVFDPAVQPIGTLAVNVEPAAARTDPQAGSALGAWLGVSGPWSSFDPEALGAELLRADAGSPLAKLLLIAVLLLVIVETLLARWFSHAYRREGDAGVSSRYLKATMYERPLGKTPGLGGTA